MANQYYSRGHYKSVSPVEDTPAQTAQKVEDQKTRKLIYQEAKELYPESKDFDKWQKYVDDEIWKRIVKRA
jgi:hypothetical protein